MLPIEEKADEALVEVIVNNICEQRLNIRLAVTKIDYYVPFDLADFAGKSVAFRIKSGSKKPTNDLWIESLKKSNDIDVKNREKYRSLFHHTPSYGWMNDPNGMFYKDGVWHLSYQHNLYGSMWGNMSWGHATSRDLIHWEQQPTVINQDAWGTVFSGSSVVDVDNTSGFGKDAIISIYTSADASQTQSLAYSLDGGVTFEKYSANPIIVSDKECRDPKVFWDNERGRWVMLLAAALEHEMWIYTSQDLKHWTKRSEFGKGYGCQNGVWECPDLLELPVRGSDEKRWMLICSINPGGPFGGSAVQYFVGDFDGERFTCDSAPEVTKWMDYGKDHYATVSWSNQPEGRNVVMGWMSNWEYAAVVPTHQFRSANTLPRDIELFIDNGEYYLAVTPIEEVKQLRDKTTTFKSMSLSKQPIHKELPTV